MGRFQLAAAQGSGENSYRSRYSDTIGPQRSKQNTMGDSVSETITNSSTAITSESHKGTGWETTRPVTATG